MYTQTQVLCTQVLEDDSILDNPDPVNSRVKVGILKTNDHDYEIFIGENFIGRADICDIVINHPGVSGKHAVIEVEDHDSHIIYDCGSTNNTKLGKIKLKPNIRYNLQDGDVITFAHSVATYIKVNEVAAQDEDASGSDTGSESLFCDSIVPETPYRTNQTDLSTSEIVVAETPTSSKNESEDEKSDAENEDVLVKSVATVSIKEMPPKEEELAVLLDLCEDSFDEIPPTQKSLFRDNPSFNNDITCRNNSIQNISTREETQLNQTKEESQDSIFNVSTQVRQSQRFSELLMFSPETTPKRSDIPTDSRTIDEIENDVNSENRNLPKQTIKDDTIYNKKDQNFVATNTTGKTNNSNDDKRMSKNTKIVPQITYNLQDIKVGGDEPSDNDEDTIYNALTQVASSKIYLRSGKNIQKTPLQNEVKLLVPDKMPHNTPFEFRTPSPRDKKCNKVTDDKLLRSSQNPLLIMNIETVNKEPQNPTFDMETRVPDSESLTQVNTKLNDSNSKIIGERKERQENISLLQNPESLVKINGKTLEKQDSILNLDTQVPDSDGLTQINPKLSDSKRKSFKEKKTRQVKASEVENPEPLLEGKEKQDPLFEMDTQVPDFDGLTQINPKLNNSKNKLTREKGNRHVKTSAGKSAEKLPEDKEKQDPIFEMDTQVPDLDGLTQINPKLNDSNKKLTREKGKRHVKTSAGKSVDKLKEDKEKQDPIYEMDTQVPDLDGLTQINPKLNDSKKKLPMKNKNRHLKTSAEKNLESVLEGKEIRNPISDVDTQVPDSDALTQMNPKLRNSKSKSTSKKKTRKVKPSVVKNLDSVFEDKETQCHPTFDTAIQIPDSDLLTQTNPKVSDLSRTSKNKCEVQLKIKESNKSVYDFERPCNEDASLEESGLSDALTQINYNLQEKHLDRNVQNNQDGYPKSKTSVSSSPLFSKSLPVSPKDKNIFKVLKQINHSSPKKNESGVDRDDRNIDDNSTDIDEDSIFNATTQVSRSAQFSKNKVAEDTNVFEALTQFNCNLKDKNVSRVGREDKNLDDNSTDIDEDSIFNATTQVSSSAPDSKTKTVEETNVYEALTQINCNLKDKNVSRVGRDDQNIDDNSTDIDEDSVFNATTQVSSNAPVSKSKGAEATNVYEALTQINCNLKDKNVSGVGRDDQNIDDNSTDIDDDSIFNATTQVSSSAPVSKTKGVEATNVYEALTQINCNLKDKNVSRVGRDDQNIDDNSTDIDEDSIFNATPQVSSSAPVSKSKGAEATNVYEVLTQINCNLEGKSVSGVGRDDRNVDDNSTDIDEDSIFNATTQVSSSALVSKILPVIENKEAGDTDISEALTQINYNLQDKSVTYVNRVDAITVDVVLPGTKGLPIVKNVIPNTSTKSDIDEESHESESMLAIVSDDLDLETMDDEDNLFEATHNDKNRTSECVSNKSLKKNDEISKAEMCVDVSLSNDEMNLEYSENSFNLPSSDVLLKAVANFEATLTPGKKPLYSDDEDDEDFIRSPQMTRKTGRLRRPTSKVIKPLDFCTENNKVAEKRNLKRKINDSKCGEQTQKEGVKMKVPVVKLKPISVDEIESFKDQSKLVKENNSKETLSANVSSSLKPENDAKECSVKEEKLIKVGKKGCARPKRVYIKGNSGESISADVNDNQTSKSKIKGEKSNNLQSTGTTKTDQSIKVKCAGNNSSNYVRAIDTDCTSKTSDVESISFISRNTRHRKLEETKNITMTYARSEKTLDTNKAEVSTTGSNNDEVKKTEIDKPKKGLTEKPFRSTRSTRSALKANEVKGKEISNDRPDSGPLNKTETKDITKNGSTHSFVNDKNKQVSKKTVKDDNSTTDLTRKRSKRIAAKKQLTVCLEDHDSDSEPLCKIRKRGRCLKNSTSKSIPQTNASCAQPADVSSEQNSSVVYDSPSYINTKTDTSSKKRERFNDKFPLPIASMSRLKDSVSCEIEDDTNSFSNKSGTSIQSVSSPGTRNIGRRKEQVLLSTGINEPKLLTKLTKLGCTIVDNPYLCTVLVTDKIRRTVKLLCCLGRGIPIVTQDWIEESKYVGIVQDPWKFLIVDKEAENRYSFSLKKSLNLAHKGPFLKNYTFYATPSVKPPHTELEGIVESCGGAFLHEIPKCWPDNSVIISCNEDRNLWQKMKSTTTPIVAAEALLLGVLQQNLNLKSYKLS